MKKNVESIKPEEVLAVLLEMPIQRWTYKTESDEVRHLGPMAQEFRAAFGLGANDVSIATVDADGVALAAIQGLNTKLEEENAALKARVEKLEKLVGGLLSGEK